MKKSLLLILLPTALLSSGVAFAEDKCTAQVESTLSGLNMVKDRQRESDGIKGSDLISKVNDYRKNHTDCETYSFIASKIF